MELIDKAAVVVEINKLKEHFINKRYDFERGYHSSLNAVSDFIDTLEVKEVDLEKEICSFFSKNPIPYEHITDWPLLKNCAIHFFELGLKAQKGE